MAGFRSVGEFVDSAEGGKNWITGFVKYIPATAGAGWFDISSGAGSYVPNYFASSPLVAAELPSNKGIFAPNTTDGDKYIKSWECVCGESTATSVGLTGAHAILCDYLMYYPFIDMTVTDLQEFENPITLPRYTDGRGVFPLLVMQSANGGYGSADFTINYTNTEDQAKTVTGNLQYASYNAYSLPAPVVNGGAVAGGPFCPLAIGDAGAKSIQSVQLSADWGGLACLVLVKPFFGLYNAQGARRTTTGNLDSFGAPMQHINFLHQVSGTKTYDGAYLTPIMRFPTTGANSGRIVGTLETVWN